MTETRPLIHFPITPYPIYSSARTEMVPLWSERSASMNVDSAALDPPPSPTTISPLFSRPSTFFRLVWPLIKWLLGQGRSHKVCPYGEMDQSQEACMTWFAGFDVHWYFTLGDSPSLKLSLIAFLSVFSSFAP